MISYIENAKRLVDGFSTVDSADELDVIEQSNQAVDCLNCEATIQVGIDAIQTVFKADEALRSASIKGLIVFDEAMEEILTELVKEWLRRTQPTLEWIDRCERRGYTVEHKDELLGLIREAKGIVDFDPDKPMPEHIARCRDEAVEEVARGEAAPLFPGTE